jgi:signal peptidase I
MTERKSLPPHLAAKMIQAMQKSGVITCLQIDGTSMEPFIMNGDKIIADHRIKDFEPGDIVLFEREDEEGSFVHRIIAIDGETVVTKGDNRFSPDKPIKISHIKGKITTVEKSDGSKIFITDEPWKTFSRMMAEVSRKAGVFHSEMMKEKTEDDGEEIHKKAYSLYHEGKDAEALTLFRQAVALNPERALSRVDMGEILRQSGQYEEAILHLRLALDIDRRKSHISAQAYNILGNTLCNMGKFAESIEEYLSSISVDPLFVPPYINRGWAYFRLGEWEKAQADIEKALKMEPKNFKALKNMALIHLSRENPEKALEYLRKASEINDRDADIMNNMGIIYLKQGDFTEAENKTKKALEINPEHYEASCNLGVILEKQGRKKEAASHYSKLLKKHNENEEIKRRLERVLKKEEVK